MSASTETIDNPFPAEAVATYGGAGPTCDSLTYMLSAQREVQDYLKAYSVETTRFGGAIGLQGAHGSGKTHVLTWLSQCMDATRSIRGNAVYGKCDSSRFSDLSSQLLKQLEWSKLIVLIQLAMLHLARSRVQLAKVTETLVERLQTTDGLQQLQDERNIDLSQLREQLLRELQASTGISTTAHIVLDLSDPILGRDAYNWLIGSPLENPAGLGIPARVQPAADGKNAESDAQAEADAIDALELVAALHRLAGVPLLVMLDQLEVLLRAPSPSAFQTVNSLTKKFIERLGRQATLIFIAGIPEAWEKLTRDVSARLRRRENIVVGNLTVDETRIFLDAFIQDPARAQAFSDAMIDRVRELSGGSPREILRIAFQAYGKVSGDFARLDEGILVESARYSGTLSDRAVVALGIVTKVCAEYGRVVTGFRAGDQGVDAVLMDEDGEIVFAILIAKATDATDEVNSARLIKSVQSFCDEHWPRAELVVVSVGYSSAQVQSILRMNAPPLVFNERTFEAELKTRVVTVTQRARRLRQQERTEDDRSIEILQAIRKFTDSQESRTDQSQDILREIRKVTDRFNQLQNQRVESAAQVKERFEVAAREHAAPMLAELSVVTRRDMLDSLDSVRDAIASGNDELQRTLMRSVLVANETATKDPIVEAIGEFFLERLALERIYGPAADSKIERLRMIGEIVDALRRTRLPQWMRSVRVFFAMMGICVVLFGVSTWTSFMSVREHFNVCIGGLGIPCDRDLVTTIPYVIIWVCLLVAFAYGTSWSLEVRDRRILQSHLNARSAKLQLAAKESTLYSQYPQSQ